MTPTLSTLRALLERAHGPGVEHLPERTLPEVTRAYLPIHLIACDGARRLCYDALHMLTRWSGSESLDLTDPGTVHALLVALALALGLDPGVMGCAVSWRCGAWGWVLRGADSSYMMSATIDEPDPIRALCAAVHHVLKESTDAR